MGFRRSSPNFLTPALHRLWRAGVNLPITLSRPPELITITKKALEWEAFGNPAGIMAGPATSELYAPMQWWLFRGAFSPMSAHETASHFEIQGQLVAVAPVNTGHIHDSHVSTWQTSRGPVRYLHQRINQNIFPDVGALMSNLRCITEHLRDHPDPGERPLSLIPARNGQDTWIDPGGFHWRTFRYIENTEVFSLCPDTAHAFEIGRVFASFVARLRDLPPDFLAVTIPDFFHTPTRARQLQESVARDAAGRLKAARTEVDFALERHFFWSLVSDPLEHNLLPHRVIHYDPKINNVLFDIDSGKAVSVVDLDTCMPGSLLYDFGDLVRTAGVDTVEDEPDPSRVQLNLALFEALAKGYLGQLGELMTPLEIRLLARAPRLATLTVGMRFLADYLNGDTYFKVDHPEHNLQRTRAQFALVKSLEELEPKMERLVGVIDSTGVPTRQRDP